MDISKLVIGDKVYSSKDILTIIKEHNLYKTAWEELKNIYDYNETQSKSDLMVLGKIREIEKKNGIGGEKQCKSLFQD